MWFIKLCLFDITVCVCRMAGEQILGWIVIFAYFLELFREHYLEEKTNDR